MKLHAGIRAFLLSAGLFATSRASARDAGGRERIAHAIRPQETTVLLLPPIDATVDSAKLAPLRQQVVRLEMEYQFIARQFVVVGDQMAAEVAAKSPAMTFGGEAGPSERVLQEISRRAQARLVVGIVVREVAATASKEVPFQARSVIDLRVWDSESGTWLVNRAIEGFASEGGPPGWLFINSLGNAVARALGD